MMSDLIDREQAIKAITTSCYLVDAMEKVIKLPSVEPDNKLVKIIDLVEGTIDHFDRDDAMDLLYQIKDVLR